MDTSFRGHLLVATPVLIDPNFFRTVVLLLEHNDDGALGVVLNRPGRTRLARHLPQWAEQAAPPGRVFAGGPVEQQNAVALASLRTPTTTGWTSITEDVGVLDLRRDPEALARAIDRVRVFAGYAGWAGGQLEAEIGDGAWTIVPPAPGEILTADPGRLWADAWRRRGGRHAWLASLPGDARRN